MHKYAEKFDEGLFSEMAGEKGVVDTGSYIMSYIMKDRGVLIMIGDREGRLFFPDPIMLDEHYSRMLAISLLENNKGSSIARSAIIDHVNELLSTILRPTVERYYFGRGHGREAQTNS